LEESKVTFLLGIWNKLQGWLIAAGAVVALLVGAYIKGRGDAADKAKTKTLEDRVKSVEKAKEVENEIRKMSPSDIDRRLDKYMRD
jgi:hypothetical protein